jgi:DNA-binding PadR family transcriptional regulator
MRETGEVKQMYIAYLREDDTYDYEIMDRLSRLHLSLSCPDESVWMVPDTESRDD